MDLYYLGRGETYPTDTLTRFLSNSNVPSSLLAHEGVELSRVGLVLDHLVPGCNLGKSLDLSFSHNESEKSSV